MQEQDDLTTTGYPNAGSGSRPGRHRQRFVIGQRRTYKGWSFAMWDGERSYSTLDAAIRARSKKRVDAPIVAINQRTSKMHYLGLGDKDALVLAECK